MQAVYSEAIAMVEEYQQAANLGGNVTGIYPQLGLKCSPQVGLFLSVTCDLYILLPHCKFNLELFVAFYVSIPRHLIWCVLLLILKARFLFGWWEFIDFFCS